MEQNYALPNGYQEIPIKFSQQLMKDECDNEFKEIDKNIEKGIAEYNYMNTTYYPFILRMTRMFNLTGNVTLNTMAALSTNIEVDLHLGMKLPEDFNDDDLKNIRHLSAWLRMFEYVGDLQKAKNKYKLEKIINMFDSRVKNPNQ